MTKTYHIIILGPQGSGKGTQADMLEKELGIVKISTGDIFRKNIKEQTELGKQVKEILDAGQLVPDELTNKIVEDRLKQPDARSGFILDGFPRNLEQAKALDNMTEITHVLEVWISDEEAVRRIGGRRSCSCGAVYHLVYNPPKDPEKCDKCGEKLFIRDDDKEEAIKKRLEIYHEQTEPIVEHYKEKGLHVKVDGMPPIAQVSESIKSALN